MSRFPVGLISQLGDVQTAPGHWLIRLLSPAECPLEAFYLFDGLLLAIFKRRRSPLRGQRRRRRNSLFISLCYSMVISRCAISRRSICRFDQVGCVILSRTLLIYAQGFGPDSAVITFGIFDVGKLLYPT